jgi:predicted ester cyclase
MKRAQRISSATKVSSINDASARRAAPTSRRRFVTGGASLVAVCLAETASLRARTGSVSSRTIQDNKAIVGRWFTEFWGNPWNPSVIDELAAPDMLLQYSLHAPRKGRDDIRAFMTAFRKAFPDLGFKGTADLIGEGDYVVGRWLGGGTHTGPAFSDFLAGSLPAASGRRMHFSGMTVIKVVNGRIAEEVGLDDGVTALTQLGLIRRS